MPFSEFELKPMAQFEALCGILWIRPYVVRGGAVSYLWIPTRKMTFVPADQM